MTLYQPELFISPERTPKSVAIDLIQGYVKRGDTLQELKAGCVGFGDSEESAQISGYCQGKRYSADWIIVSKFQGKQIHEVFKLKEIFEGVKNSL